MNIKSLASSSAGNAYFVSDGQTPLLLEAGIPLALLRRGLGFTTSTLAGVLLSHSHQDHSSAVKDLLKSAIDCYMSAGTAEALGVQGHHRIHIIKADQEFKIGTWTIHPFETEHDAAEPLGFMLASGNERLLFATDTAYIKPRFNGLTHLMIECNYSLDILRESVRTGAIPKEHKTRVMRSHMSLETLRIFLEENDISKVQTIHLLHLSDENSDGELFKRMVEGWTGKPVKVARK